MIPFEVSGWLESLWNTGLYFVPLLVFVVNLLTTIHIILNKKNIRAAIGWVGLVWFSPGPGAVLYAIFGINRIRRRARRMFQERDEMGRQRARFTVSNHRFEQHLADRGDSHLKTLNRLTGSLSHFPLTRGNRIEPLIGGKKAYDAMIESIEDADRSITFSTYIFDRDRAGMRFGEALLDAHRRGVEIRVLIDDVGGKYSFRRMSSWLRSHQIPCELFMRSRVPWHVRYYNLRNHRKILVVDGKIGFTGGMNIREGYLPNESGETVQDIHFQLRGPVVHQLQQVFAEDWLFTAGERLEGPEWFSASEEEGTDFARGISDGPDEDYDSLRHTFFGAVTNAEESIRILTPYFLPDEELTTALKITARRGIDVRVLVPKVGNLRMVQWASEGHFQELVESGVRIFRSSPPFDHSKLFIVDDTWVCFGSANWDPRSLKLNFEFNVECYGELLATEVGGWFDRKQENADQVSRSEIRNWNLFTRLRNNIFRLGSPYL